MNGNDYFDIQRGVKQGDVISPMLFNVALEIAFRKWKLRLTHHGLLVNVDHERLTNSRYADDIMMYAKSLDELHDMVHWLMEELANVGLQLNGSKTKIPKTMADPPKDC